MPLTSPKIAPTGRRLGCDGVLDLDHIAGAAIASPGYATQRLEPLMVDSVPGNEPNCAMGSHDLADHKRCL